MNLPKEDQPNRESKNSPIGDKSALLRQYPELAIISDPYERAEVWREVEASGSCLHSIVQASIYLFSGVLTGLLNHYIMPLFVPWWGAHEIPDIVVMFCALFGSLLIFRYAQRHRIEEIIRQQLIERGYPVCVKCGYDLRGQTEPRCPECSQSFDPGILAMKPSGEQHAN